MRIALMGTIDIHPTLDDITNVINILEWKPTDIYLGLAHPRLYESGHEWCVYFDVPLTTTSPPDAIIFFQGEEDVNPDHIELIRLWERRGATLAIMDTVSEELLVRSAEDLYN